jgi:hypothetical protein
MNRPPPKPPRPDLVRRPSAHFGWLDDRLLHESWLSEVGPDAVAVLVLFALAADSHGASFFSRARMAVALGIDLDALNSALQRLLELELVAHRPWRPGARDGVWQLLPLPRRSQPPRSAETLSFAQVLASIVKPVPPRPPV